VEKRTKIELIILMIGFVVITGWFYQIDQMQVSNGEFDIYLVRNGTLVLSDEDIIWYDESSYEMKLTNEGAKKIRELKVGVYGEPFSIRIGNEEIYNGSFWSPMSSVGYRGIVIEIPFNLNDNIITIEKGYPSNSFQGIDPRGDPRIHDHFQRIEKLKHQIGTISGLGAIIATRVLECE